MPNIIILSGRKRRVVGLRVSVVLALLWEDSLERFFPEVAGTGNLDELIKVVLACLEGTGRNMDMARTKGVGPELKLLGHGSEDLVNLLPPLPRR
jgi:hypothetical protein